MTAALGGEWSAARPGRTLPPGKTRYPLYRKLGGPQGRSGRAENLAPTGFDLRTVQPIVNRFTDWATRPTFVYVVSCFYKINTYRMQLLVIRAGVFVGLLQRQCDRHACVVPCCVLTPYFLSAGDNVVQLYQRRCMHTLVFRIQFLDSYWPVTGSVTMLVGISITDTLRQLAMSQAHVSSPLLVLGHSRAYWCIRLMRYMESAVEKFMLNYDW